MAPTIETERLRLRPLTWDDLPFFQWLHSDPLVTQYLARGRPSTESEVAEWLEKTLAMQASEGLGHLGVTRKDSGELIGRCGVSAFEVEAEVDAAVPRAWWGKGSAPQGLRTEAMLELGYTLHPNAWGLGFASEASRAMRDWAFQTKKAERVMSLIHPENARSKAVAQRNGFAVRGEVEFLGRRFEKHELARLS